MPAAPAAGGKQTQPKASGRHNTLTVFGLASAFVVSLAGLADRRINEARDRPTIASNAVLVQLNHLSFGIVDVDGPSIDAASRWLGPNRLAIEPAALMMVLANFSIMATAVGKYFAGLRRLIVSSLFVLGISATLVASGDTIAWWHPSPIFSPAVTIAALIVLVFRDGLITIRTLAGGTSPQTVVVAAVVLAVSTYMVVIPVTDALLETLRERPQSYTIDELSAFEVLRIRSAKLAVFAIFAYAGACVGSFLNVVAASAPRGEPIALRSSACPKCGTPIRRTDNLPIISYLRLRGRCRDCDDVIPIRYFIVELVGFSIFATLFLYQLISGAANVPGFQQYHFAGILWIILYTKWPVIGIYFFHCALFSCALMLALMEQDRLPPPRRMAFALPSVFALLAIVSPTMLTVSLGDQTPWSFPATLPEWLDRAATCATGAVTGGVVARLAEPMRLRHRQSSASLAPALVLLGISLGWQAVVTIAALWFVAMIILKWSGGQRMRPRWLTPTTLLFVVAMLHHPAWKWLAGQVSF